MREIDFFIMAVQEILEAPEGNKPPKSLKIIIIFGVVVLLIGGGIACLFLFAPKSEENTTFLGRIRTLWASEKKEGSPLHGYIYKMEPFLVNLVDPGQLRYLKITIHIESDQEKVNEDYEKRLPQLRDAILTILSSKNYKDIMNVEGKTALREEIKAKLNQLAVSFKVQNIYFTEFVVQ
jgi:flagellar FliL protein